MGDDPEGEIFLRGFEYGFGGGVDPGLGVRPFFPPQRNGPPTAGDGVGRADEDFTFVEAGTVEDLCMCDDGGVLSPRALSVRLYPPLSPGFLRASREFIHSVSCVLRVRAEGGGVPDDAAVGIASVCRSSAKFAIHVLSPGYF